MKIAAESMRATLTATRNEYILERRGVVTLDKFIENEKCRLENFHKNWRMNQSSHPEAEAWPESMPEADWVEQLQMFEE